MSETPEQIPSIGKSTLRAFGSLEKFFDFFKAIQPDDTQVNGNSEYTYKTFLQYVYNYIEREIEGKSGMDWYGSPHPESLAEALSRERYLNMDDYNNVFNTIIKPRLEEILKDSKADLEMPVLKYNDRDLGIFDFNRAAIGLIPTNNYWSIKNKDFVDASLVQTYKEGNSYKYKLIKGGSPVVLVPKLKNVDAATTNKIYKEVYDGQNIFEVIKKYGVKIGGSADAFTSNIKKSYLLKEKTKKPKNAVRLFVSLGANCSISGSQYKWNGYAATGIAELLSTLGYAVSIIGVYGLKTEINVDGGLSSGTRYFGITLKSFEETLDTGSILYTLSDATFFRVRFFECIAKSTYYYRDFIEDGMGYVATIPEIKKMVYAQYGKRDDLFKENGKKNTNSPFLYYIIGDNFSEEQLNELILNIGLDVVNENMLAAQNI